MGWGGHLGEIVPSRAFLVILFIFLVPSTRPQLTLRSVDFRSVHPKNVSVVESKLPFLPPKYIFNGPNKAIILHGSE